MQRLVIWGAGGHASVVADLARLDGRFEVVGFVDSQNPSRHGERFLDSVVLGGAECLPGLRTDGVTGLVVAIGDNPSRLRLAAAAQELGFELVTLRHPAAVLAGDVVLGRGTIVAAGVVVGPGAVIGDNAILNTACSVDHHCVILDGVHVAPGVRLAGRVRVGRGAWIGIGATVIDRVEIGEAAVVGAGAVVIGDVASGTTVVGVPARPRSARQGPSASVDARSATARGKGRT